MTDRMVRKRFLIGENLEKVSFYREQTVAGKIKLKFLYNLQIEKQLEMSNKKLCFGERFCYPLRFLASRFFRPSSGLLLGGL